MKKILALILIIILLFCGCTSSEVKEVISDISSLGEITIDSEIQLFMARSKFEALDEKEKTKVTNIDVLEKAEEQFEALNLDKKIAENCAEITAESFNVLSSLLNEYNSLTNEQKTFVTNHDLLEKSIETSRSLLVEEKVAEIVEEANGDWSHADRLFMEYADYMTEKQKVECLLQLGRWKAFDKAEEKIKNSLKYPSSYKRYSGKTKAPEKIAGTTYGYKVRVTIDCSGMNSFGGMTRDTFYADVKFTLYPSKNQFEIYDIDIW